MIILLISQFDTFSPITLFIFIYVGSEVAKYVAKHLPEALKNTETYKKGEFKQSMVDSFLQVDQLIISDEVGN